MTVVANCSFNSFSSTKALHTVTAVIEIGAGLALLCFPSVTVTLLVGSPLETSSAQTVARVGGAGLLALGVACWLARIRHAKRSRERGLVAAMLLYAAAPVAVLAFAGLGFGLRSVGLWPAVFLHSVMTVWCVACLRQKCAQAPFFLEQPRYSLRHTGGDYCWLIDNGVPRDAPEGEFADYIA